MSDTLQLALGQLYVDAEGFPVRIVVQYDEITVDYQRGFRFRGDNNTNYCDDGSIVGAIGEATVFQPGSSPIVGVLEGVGDSLQTLYLGECYRNAAGMVTMMIALVPEDDRYYAEGYRIIDDRGTYYRPDGVYADSGLWVGLNLVSHVPIEEVTTEEMDKIHAVIERNVAWLNRIDRVKGFFKRWSIPVGVGVALGFGTNAAIAG